MWTSTEEEKLSLCSLLCPSSKPLSYVTHSLRRRIVQCEEHRCLYTFVLLATAFYYIVVQLQCHVFLGVHSHTSQSYCTSHTVTKLCTCIMFLPPPFLFLVSDNACPQKEAIPVLHHTMSLFQPATNHSVSQRVLTFALNLVTLFFVFDDIMYMLLHPQKCCCWFISARGEGL